MGALAVGVICLLSSPLSGQNGAEPRLKLSPDSAAVVEGRVVRSDGTPVAGAAVGLLGSTDSTATSDSGRFKLRGVSPGALVLWIRGPGLAPTRVAVALSAGLTRTLTITVAQHI